MLLGQRAAAQTLRFGAKIGINYSDPHYRGVTGDDTTGVFSYHLGAVGRYAFGRAAFRNLQTELLYSRKGDQFTIRGGPGNAASQHALNYLDLPVLVKINARGFTAEAGPQVGYLLGTSYEAGAGTTHDRSGFRKLQLGYVAGVGYGLQSGYSLTIRYKGDALPSSSGLFQGAAYSVFMAQVSYLLGKQK